MEFLQAVAAIRQLEMRRTASADPITRAQMRLAARWIKHAAVSPTTVGINEMCYAQVLNAALGIAGAFSPMSNPLASYSATRKKALAGKKDGKWPLLDDSWLNPESQNLYLPVYKSVKAASGLTPEEKDDLLMRILMGIGTAMKETEEGAGDWAQTLREGPAFWLAGSDMKLKIRNGSSLPTTMGSGGVVNYVIVIARNAMRDIHRNQQRKQTQGVERDDEFGGTAFSADSLRQEMDAPENVATMVIKKPAMLEMLFSQQLPKAAGGTRDALIAEARSYWSALTALTAVRRLKDPTRGRALILAYLDLVAGGVVDPKFPAIASLALQDSPPELKEFRLTTPLKGNDWTETKEIAFSSLSQSWQRSREAKGLLTKFVAESER